MRAGLPLSEAAASHRLPRQHPRGTACDTADQTAKVNKVNQSLQTKGAAEGPPGAGARGGADGEKPRAENKRKRRGEGQGLLAAKGGGGGSRKQQKGARC